MNKKIAPLLFLPFLLLTGCGNAESNTKAVFGFGDLSYVEYLPRTNSEIESSLSNKEDFLLVIYLQGCGCWTDFENKVLNKYISNYHIPVYAIESKSVTSTFGGLLTSSEIKDTPILGIYENGVLKKKAAYSSSNEMFKIYSAFEDWMDESIILPRQYYIDKSTFDTMLQGTEPFIVYYSLKGCPDCGLLDKLFLEDYMSKQDMAKRIYVVETYTEGFRLVDGVYDKPHWQEVKDTYGLSNAKNTLFGYNTGYVPTLQYIVPDGTDHLVTNDISPIIKDMFVSNNDAIAKDKNGNVVFSSTYFTTERMSAIKYGAGLSALDTITLKASDYVSGEDDEGNPVIEINSEETVKYYFPFAQAFLETYLPLI